MSLQQPYAEQREPLALLAANLGRHRSRRQNVGLCGRSNSFETAVLKMKHMKRYAPTKIFPAQTAPLSAQIEVMLPRDQHGDRPAKHQPYAKAVKHQAYVEHR